VLPEARDQGEGESQAEGSEEKPMNWIAYLSMAVALAILALVLSGGPPSGPDPVSV